MTAIRWWVSWAGPDPAGSDKTTAIVEHADSHALANRLARHLADVRGGIASVCKPDGATTVAVYTSAPNLL